VIKNLKIYLIFLIITFISSCTLLQFDDSYIKIKSNKWSGEEIFLSDVSNDITRNSDINYRWSRLRKQRRVPYHRIKENKAIILGNTRVGDKNFLVIQLDNKRKYKWEKYYWEESDLYLTGHICRNNTKSKAQNMIGQDIWLNYFLGDTILINNSPENFDKFQKVKIIGTEIYYNGGRDSPIWLKILSKKGNTALLRFNGMIKNIGRQNYYFNQNPFLKNWSKKMKEKIIAGKIEIGMNKKQVRTAIGNPDVINNTSSRQNISQQWIYGRNISNKKYLLFEYDKLVSM